ncbi:MAG: preprotein translocase subunit SecA, partial [bacterium]|nr:preprotein translocase subunit SecA [bacterium]
EDLLPDAFALVREAAQRTLGQRPFDTQMLGGMVLALGAVAEMTTGEGKTLSAVAPAYLNALSGEGVHVVTVNDYLARRDAVWMGQIYRALGLSVSCIVPNAAYLYDPEFKIPPDGETLIDKERDMTGSFIVQHEFLRPITRREAYLADITYGTNHEFGFDYLRDNLAYARTDQVQREPHYAIVDEIDSILIDEARTPLIISAPDAQSSDFYKTFARVVMNLNVEDDYTVDEKFRSVSITEPGVEKVERMIGVQNVYAPENLRLVHFLEESLKAKALYHRDKDYIVKNGEVIIVDEFTGRLLAGRRYNSGLHQAIEAKEGVVVKEESRTYAKISIQNYFRMYKKISGMTGTAQTSAEEFHKVYSLEVISIPTNRPLVRKDASDMIYKDAKAKWTAVVAEIKRRYEKGQPVLVGTTSITKNELVSALLSQAAVPHKVLNAKNNEGEGATIAQAGRFKTVTVATNMAGRGVDVILGGNPPNPEEAAKIKELGGLYVLGTERHEARRIDNQLRGRSGRQGDPGESQFFMALDDDLLRIFGGDKIKSMMDRFNIPDDQPIEIGFVSKAIAEAQAKVEGANFDMRKHLLEYDDVLNKQRKTVYARRQAILESVFKGDLSNLIFESAKTHYGKLDASLMAMAQSGDMPEGDANKPDMKKTFTEAGIVTKESSWPEEDSPEKIEGLLTKRSLEVSFHPMAFRQLLGILDLLWMDHLEGLDALTESVGLRAYGQHDPLVEYRQEAHRLFKDFWVNFDAWIFTNLFKLADSQSSAEQAKKNFDNAPRITAAKPLPAGGKVGRNDPCPCGAKYEDGTPKKYKHCHGGVG